MILFFNGRFVPEEQAVVSVFDRSFLYGDGLFETLRVSHSRPFRWLAHWNRLKAGAELLGIPIPFEEAVLCRSAMELCSQNRIAEGVLRLTMTRGRGRRGYSIEGARSPNCVMSIHALPDRPTAWSLVTVSGRLPTRDRLGAYKTCNKLPQILARAEAESRGAQEALLLNDKEVVAESSSGNVFWIREGVVCTPPVSTGILPGITRAVVVELCHRFGIPLRECETGLSELFKTEGMFLTLSSLGVMPVESLDGVKLSASPVIDQLAQHYDQLLCAETSKNRS